MSTERFVQKYAHKFSMIAFSNHNKYPSLLRATEAGVKCSVAMSDAIAIERAW